MNTLYLLRHANADRAGPDMGDRDRVLSSTGLQACISIADLLHEDGIRPGLILCSSALRTRQTLSAIKHIWSSPPQVIFDGRIYEAHSEDVRNVIAAHSDQHQEIMVIGHNPGLQDLALKLSSTPGAQAHRDALSDFAPGNLAKLYADEDSWSAMTLRKFAFLKLYRP